MTGHKARRLAQKLDTIHVVVMVVVSAEDSILLPARKSCGTTYFKIYVIMFAYARIWTRLLAHTSIS